MCCERGFKSKLSGPPVRGNNNVHSCRAVSGHSHPLYPPQSPSSHNPLEPWARLLSQFGASAGLSWGRAVSLTREVPEPSAACGRGQESG